MESDDRNNLCTYPALDAGNYPCSPELKQVTLGPAHYDASGPSVRGNSGLTYNPLTALTPVLDTGGCGAQVTYTLSPNGTNWYYFNGSDWLPFNNTAVQSTAAAALTPTVISTFAGQMGVGTAYVTAFLNSTGQTSCASTTLF